jgi:AcrR family transcriptional regulator
LTYKYIVIRDIVKLRRSPEVPVNDQDRDVVGSVRRRPRDRKAQIASTAAGLFSELGYHRVSIEDIAGAVGITGRAIYRHFDNKYDLLATTIFEDVDRVEALFQDAGHEGDASALLASSMASIAQTMLERRNLGVLVLRESRYLEPADRAKLDRRLDAIAQRLQTLLRAARPELDDEAAMFLARYAMAVLTSPSFHNAQLSRTAGVDLLQAMALAVFGTSAFASRRDDEDRDHAAGTASDVSRVDRASRRETVLAAAVDLFAERGYAAVRMEDVGAAVGIAGPSIYEHFTSKVDLLMAAMTRGAEWLQFGLARSLDSGGTAAERLTLVLRSYVDFCLRQSDLMGVFLSESIHLPEEKRHVLRRVQHEYVAEWIRLLVSVRPSLTEPEAHFITHGVLGIANDVARTGYGRRRADIEDVLVSIGLDVLDSSGTAMDEATRPRPRSGNRGARATRVPHAGLGDSATARRSRR